MRSSFEIIDFFNIRAKFFEEYTIFKKNSVKKMGKSIFQNLMSSALFGYISIIPKKKIFSSILINIFARGC